MTSFTPISHQRVMKLLPFYQCWTNVYSTGTWRSKQSFQKSQKIWWYTWAWIYFYCGM